MARPRNRVCSNCSKNRVVSAVEASHVYPTGLDDHEKDIIGRALNDPRPRWRYVCSWCWTQQVKP